MKRLFVIAVLSSTLMPCGLVLAGNPAPGNPGNPAINGGQPNTGNPAINTGNPAINTGNPAINNGNPAVNPGNPVINNGNPAINAGQPAANATGSLSILKTVKEMHGRMDGQTLAAGGINVAGVTGVEVRKECKAPEHSQELVNYVFQLCRAKAGIRMCGPCMPFGMPGPFGMQPQFGMPGPFGMQAPPAPFGDLELVNVGMVSDAMAEQGPIYRVTMFNNSPMPSRDFHVSIIALLGEFNDGSVVVTVPVKYVAPNASATIDVQLPINVMAMGTPAAPFDTLIAAVDSFDELAETSELNNVAVITRTEVVSITVKVEETAVATVSGVAVVAPAVAPAIVPAVVAPAPNPADALPPAAQPADGLPTITNDLPATPAQSSAINLDNVDGAKQLLGG